MRFGRYLTAILVTCAATAALAHGTATGIVKERMDGMVALGESMKALAPMMTGQAEMDAGVVAKQAALIKANSGEAITAKFPEGTGGMPSEARDEIWENWQAFSSLADRLEMLAATLEKRAMEGNLAGDHGSMMEGGEMGKMMSGGMPDEDMLAQMPAEGLFMMIGRTCSECHESFRVKMN